MVDAPITRSAPSHLASVASFSTVFCTDKAVLTTSRNVAASASACAVSLPFTARTR